MSPKRKRYTPPGRPRASSRKEPWSAWYNSKRPLLLYGCRFAFVLVTFYACSLTSIYQNTLSEAVSINARMAHALMQGFGEQSILSGATFRFGTDAIITVEPACTGINYSWFLIAAVVAFPASLIRKLLGILIGVAGLLLLNVLRVSSLFWVGVHSPEFFAFVHEQLWAVLLNIATVSLLVTWIVWIKSKNANETPATA